MGFAAGGRSIPLRFSRGRVPSGQATGWPEQIPAPGPGSEEVQGGATPQPLPSRPPGIQAETWPAGAWGWGKLVISAPASSFHTPLLSLASPLSLPPAAARCQHYIPFSSFSSLPTPYPPIPTPPGRSPPGKSFHLNPLLPALNVRPVSFPRGTCMVKPCPEPWHLATGNLVDSDGLRVGLSRRPLKAACGKCS